MSENQGLQNNKIDLTLSTSTVCHPPRLFVFVLSRIILRADYVEPQNELIFEEKILFVQVSKSKMNAFDSF